MAYSLSRALASSNVSVKAYFTDIPLFETPLQVGDASNIAYWTLTNVSSGAIVPMLSVAPTDVNTVLEFTIYGRWKNYLDQFRLTGSALLKSSTNVAFTAPLFANFNAMPAVPLATPADAVDIQNSVTQPNLPLGALSVGTDGDYAKERGITLLRKLIIRRIISRQGEFLNLAGITYGAGVEAKSFYNSSELTKLKAYIEFHATQEPEVEAANAGITIGSKGEFKILISAKLRKSKQSFTINVALPSLGTVAF